MDRDRLAAIPFFKGLSDDELDAVARVAEEREFAAGDPMTLEGDFGHCTFVIEAGTAQASVDGRHVDELGPGAVVGEVAVLSSGRRTASVVATSPVRALALFKRDVWALERDAPETAERLRDALERHLGPFPA